jgi:hypothetical protein
MIGWDWPVQAAYALIQPVASDDPLHERSRLGTPYAEPAEPTEHSEHSEREEPADRKKGDAPEPARRTARGGRAERVVVLGNWFT